MTKKQQSHDLKRNFRLVAVIANLEKRNNKGAPIEEWVEIGNYETMEEFKQAQEDYIQPIGFVKFEGNISLI